MKSFVLQVQNLLTDKCSSDIQPSIAWKGLAPARAEILVWFVLQEKLSTKERLSKLNIIPQDQALCPFCNEHPETVRHLFFGCSISWKLWSECLQWWNVHWCTPLDPILHFQCWCGVAFYGIVKKCG